MSLFSIFSKKPPEPTSVAEALAGVGEANTGKATKAKSRRNENRHTDAQNEQLIPEKKRARRRLIGAVAIVLAVVIGLPMVLDSEPKPLNKNIVIQIPSKDLNSPVADVKEDGVPPESTDQAAKPPTVALADTPQRTVTPVVQPPVAAAGAAVETNSAKAVKSETKVDNKADNKSDNKSDSKPDNKSESKHSDTAAKKDSTTKVKADTKPVDVKAVDTKSADAHLTKADESARALAILGGSDNAAPKTGTRIVVQVGAFATQEKVNELQDKLSSAGIKSFTQKVATSSGDKIRVRIGPFSDRGSADKMKAQLEKLGINGSLISL